MKSLFHLPSVARLLSACALSLGLAVTAQAAPVTGDPQTNAFGWVPNSTNALNYAQLTPGRLGQVAPYVLFNSNTLGSVTLDFFNLATGVEFFETRIDDIETGVIPHAVVIGDTQHTGGTFLAANTSLLGKTFLATNYVDIRLALGAESDYRFDWVRFDVEQAQVPEPSSLALVVLALAGLGYAARRRRA